MIAIAKIWYVSARLLGPFRLITYAATAARTSEGVMIYILCCVGCWFPIPLSLERAREDRT